MYIGVYYKYIYKPNRGNETLSVGVKNNKFPNNDSAFTPKRSSLTQSDVMNIITRNTFYPSFAGRWPYTCWTFNGLVMLW